MTRESFVSLLPLGSALAQVQPPGTRIVTKRSRLSYQDTLAALEQHITASGNTVFATIDQAAAAQKAGTTLRPTTLIIFGNPKAGTPLMDADPLIGLELPLKVQVWQEGVNVNLAYEPLAEIAKRYGLTGMDARIAAVDRTVDTLTNSVT